MDGICVFAWLLVIACLFLSLYVYFFHTFIDVVSTLSQGVHVNVLTGDHQVKFGRIEHLSYKSVELIITCLPKYVRELHAHE